MSAGNTKGIIKTFIRRKTGLETEIIENVVGENVFVLAGRRFSIL